MIQVWRHIVMIPPLGRQKQKDQEFKASLGYIERKKKGREGQRRGGL